ncbi:MAG: hypothetical protein LBB06_01535, partial [Endomicrobium sp.]|nr:hypothetical protein [Endomicrobium sp.]
KRDKIERKIMRKGGKEEEVEIVEKVDNVLKATVSKDYGNNGFAPKLEYCYYVSEQPDIPKAGNRFRSK